MELFSSGLTGAMKTEDNFLPLLLYPFFISLKLMMIHFSLVEKTIDDSGLQNLENLEILNLRLIVWWRRVSPNVPRIRPSHFSFFSSSPSADADGAVSDG